MIFQARNLKKKCKKNFKLSCHRHPCPCVHDAGQRCQNGCRGTYLILASSSSSGHLSLLQGCHWTSREWPFPGWGLPLSVCRLYQAVAWGHGACWPLLLTPGVPGCIALAASNTGDNWSCSFLLSLCENMLSKQEIGVKKTLKIPVTAIPAPVYITVDRDARGGAGAPGSL